jgi:hypothetical protein
LNDEVKLNMLRLHLLAFIAALFLVSCTTLQGLPGATRVPLTEAEAAQGIREALDQGLGRGIATLHRENGFFQNNVYKILLPPEAQRVESVLRQLGMDAMVDRAVLQINRAAEDAVGAAGPIFTGAIRQMTLADALSLVSGPQDTATRYFRTRTADQLKAAFTPIIKQSLDKFSATKYYEDVINTYNRFPTTIQKVNPDLTSYVTDKVITALFDQIAQEEANIRSNARARTSEILRRVFGGR